MENENRTHKDSARKDLSGCNVSQKFNFSVGMIALAVAGIIAYLIYKYFIQG
jgi:hypothetical protein